MPNLSRFLTHCIFNPIANFFFGRPCLTRTQLSHANINTDFVIGILFPCRAKLEVMIECLEESGIRCRAARLLDEVRTEIAGLCADWLEMSAFWHHYSTIFGRSALTEAEIRRGNDMFEYWTEGEGWKKLAWAKREEVEEILEIGTVNVRQRLAAAQRNEQHAVNLM